MRAAGVLVRDRSSDPGCDGRVRITIEPASRCSWLSGAEQCRCKTETWRRANDDTKTVNSKAHIDRRAEHCGDAHRSSTHHRRPRPVQSSDWHSLLRPHAGAVHPSWPFDLELECDGDLDVDQHHTVEDVGIALVRLSMRSWRQARHFPRWIFPHADG